MLTANRSAIPDNHSLSDHWLFDDYLLLDHMLTDDSVRNNEPLNPRHDDLLRTGARMACIQ